MASPPFNIDQALPGDSDIVSQHPINARTFRDVVESWLLVNHNTNGRHDEVALDHKSDPSAPGSGITEVWASSSSNAAGRPKMRRGTGATEFVQCPPGSVMALGTTSIPEGWLRCNGQDVSRTTYALLFDVIGTTFGSGSGSTFMVPNIPNLGTNLIYIIKT